MRGTICNRNPNARSVADQIALMATPLHILSSAYFPASSTTHVPKELARGAPAMAINAAHFATLHLGFHPFEAIGTPNEVRDSINFGARIDVIELQNDGVIFSTIDTWMSTQVFDREGSVS
jgi:hypothetical protein